MVSRKTSRTAKTNKNESKKKVANQKKSTNEENIIKESNSRKRGSTSTTGNDETSKKPRLDDSTLDNIPSGVILTLGQGDMGQLGLGDEILSRKKPALIKDLADDRMVRVVAGAMHTICLTTDNKMYSFGCNDEYALGRETNDDTDSEYMPKLIAGPLMTKQVMHVTAGDSHSTALTNQGEVYVWGAFRDSHGKLGLLKEGQVCKAPTHLGMLKERIISIASGNDHIAMVGDSGKVHTMGCSEQGQLGRVARYFADRGGRRKMAVEEVLLFPSKVSIPKVKGSSKKSVISRAFCGAYCTWVESSDGDIFGWGLNNFNQLGFPDSENRYLPQHVTSFSSMNLKEIRGGQHHTLLLDHKGNVFALGRGDYGRLGLGEDTAQANEPTQIESLSNIVSISSCACVSFALDKDGEGYGWGIGTNLQLTTGSEDDEWTPVQLTGKNLEERKIIEIAAGGQHTVVLACDQDDVTDEERT